MLGEKEIMWYQWDKVKEALKSDSNMKYFQLVHNEKHKKTRIFQLQNGDQIISGDEELKKPTHQSQNNKLFLNEIRIDDIPQYHD